MEEKEIWERIRNQRIVGQEPTPCLEKEDRSRPWPTRLTVGFVVKKTNGTSVDFPPASDVLEGYYLSVHRRTEGEKAVMEVRANRVGEEEDRTPQIFDLEEIEDVILTSP